MYYKSITFILLAGVACVLSSCNSGAANNLADKGYQYINGPAPLIQNGDKVTDPNLNAMIPLILMEKGNYYSICTGTLLANDKVLTAAHCALNLTEKALSQVYTAKNLTKPIQIKVLLSKDLTTPIDISQGLDKVNNPNTYLVAAVYVHKDAFKGASITEDSLLIQDQSQMNDLAILKLSQPVAKQYKYASLASENPSIQSAEIIAGYGLNVGSGVINRPEDDNGAAGILRAANSFVYELGLGGSYLAVGGISPQNSQAYTKICQGDSGGPDLIRNSDQSYSITGVHSYGQGSKCGKLNTPGWSVSVAYYRQWINNGYLDYHI